MKNEYKDLFEKIYPYTIKIMKKSIENSTKVKSFNCDTISHVYTIFFIRSISPTSFNHNFMYVSTDDFIQCFLEYEKKFWIYYYNKSFEGDLQMKRDLVKMYTVLLAKNILIQKEENSENKTRLFLTCGLYPLDKLYISAINISYKPLTYRIINNNIWLIGCAFINTILIFRPNHYSGEYVNMLDLGYINKLINTKVCINKDDFYDIYNMYEEEYKIKIDDIHIHIKDILNLMSILSNDISVLKSKISINYENMTKEEILSFINIEGVSINKKNVYVSIFHKILSRVLNKNNAIYSFVTKYKKVDEYVDLDQNDLIYLPDDSEKVEIYDGVDESTIDEIVNENRKNLISIFKKWKLLTNTNELIKFDYDELSLKKKEYEGIQKDLSKLFHIFNFKIIKDMNIFDSEIYFPFFFDFRCRKYDDTSISVTNFKPSRYFLNYGYYSDLEIEEANKNKYYSGQILQNVELLKLICKKYDLNFNLDYILTCVFWCLIAIGKEFMVKLKSEYKTEDILMIGIETIEKNTPSTLEEKIILNHYLKIIKSLNEKNPLKRFIHKDATASFIQNLIRLIGPKNEESLIKSNLMSCDIWYDTYNIILSKWKNNIKVDDKYVYIENDQYPKFYMDLFTRKTVKKPIMTASYDSSYKTKWDYFSDEVYNDKKIDIKGDKYAILLFSNFTKFINYYWDCEILAEKSSLLIDEIMEKINKFENAKINSCDIETDIIYYTKLRKRIKITVKIEKGIYAQKSKDVYYIDKSKIDKKKMRQSTKANWVHFSDAILVKQINDEYERPFLTIHDCFLIDMLNVSKFIFTANKSFKNVDTISLKSDKNLYEKINSIFIFI